MKITRQRLNDIVVETAMQQFKGQLVRRRKLMNAVEEEVRNQGWWAPQDDKLSGSSGEKSKGLAEIDFSISELKQSGRLLNPTRDNWYAPGPSGHRRVIFASVGYMKYYAGPQKGDEKPKHGGSYNTDQVGHEVYNFKPAENHVYGYFQPYLRRETEKRITLNLGRIDQSARNTDSIADVLVVFVSRSDTAGQVIVGWYDNATVYREYQKPTSQMQRANYWYLLRAESRHAVLLPEKYRTHGIPKGAGAFGRASVVYPCESDGSARNFHSGAYAWIGKALLFVDLYDGPNLLSHPFDNLEDQIEEIVENEKTERSGQGFRVTPEQRKKIEEFAVKRATKHFESLGYEVKNVGKTRSYDLECRKGSAVLRVEVKGTQTDGASVILTPNEVANAKKHLTALFVLHSIKWLRIGSSALPTGGKPLVLNPWQIDAHGRLQPLSYMYEIGTLG